MKKSKFIVGSLLGLVALGVIGTTIALYSRVDADKGITISGEIKTDGGFTLDKVTEGNVSPDDFIFDPVNKVFTVRYNLGAEINESSLYKQPISIATAKIKVETTDLSFDKVFEYAKVSAFVDGYEDDSVFTTNTELNTFVFKQDSSNTFVSSSLDIVFSNDSTSYGTQYIELKIDCSNVSDDNLIQYVLDTGFKYTISLESPSNFDFAYVVGDFDDCNWSEQDAYRMVPNLKSQNYEWMYFNLLLETGNQLKCVKDGIYSNHNGGNYVYEDENSLVNVFWDGNSDHQLTLNKVTEQL